MALISNLLQKSVTLCKHKCKYKMNDIKLIIHYWKYLQLTCQLNNFSYNALYLLRKESKKGVKQKIANKSKA